MQTQVYLFFDGRTDEALDFSEKTLGIEVEMLMRFKDAPADPNVTADPTASPGQHERRDAFVVQARRPARHGVRRQCGGKPEFKGFALSLAVKTEAEADKLSLR